MSTFHLSVLGTCIFGDELPQSAEGSKKYGHFNLASMFMSDKRTSNGHLLVK